MDRDKQAQKRDQKCHQQTQKQMCVQPMTCIRDGRLQN